VDFDRLPGGALIRSGLDDLAARRESDAALLVLIGSPRLRRLGFPVPAEPPAGVEHRLYARLSAEHPDSAHARYNTLIRVLVRFERAVECAT